MRQTLTLQVGPIPFRVVPFDGALDIIVAAALGETPTAVHFANAYSIALADHDPAYAGLFTQPNAVVFTDGVPVAWVGRRAYSVPADQWPRVYGPDVMAAALTRPGLRHFLLGGTGQTLAALRTRIAADWPEAEVVGALSPPFRALTPADQRHQDRVIRDSGANIVWIGLGTPKQDWEAARLVCELPVVAAAVGAAFDFLAGTKQQAPAWMQRSGTEWAFRFATEPRRLARRYLWGNPRFLVAAARRPGLKRGGNSRD